MAILCPGCHKNFITFGGWSQHLSQTSHPACRAIYEERRTYLPGVEPESLDEDDSEQFQHEDDIPPPQQTFNGDYFGDDYGEDDFPGWQDSRKDDSASSTDESSSDDEPEPDLEPPAPRAADPGPDPEPMDDERGRILTADERRKAKECFWTMPIVQTYPGRAGEVVEEEVESGYEGYKESIGGNVSENLYAPFNSKIDWEMAKWAKLRGPGSTAVTELMGIEDVSSGSSVLRKSDLIRRAASRDTETFLQECTGVE